MSDPIAQLRQHETASVETLEALPDAVNQWLGRVYAACGREPITSDDYCAAGVRYDEAAHQMLVRFEMRTSPHTLVVRVPGVSVWPPVRGTH